MAFCTQCGKPLRQGAGFCSTCGAEIKSQGQDKKKAEPISRPDKIHTKRQSSAESPPAAHPEKQINKRTLIIKAATKGLAKSLALSAVVLGPGFILLAIDQLVIGMIWLFAGSFGMMAWTYRKPWRLTLITCFLPPLAALVSYLIQLALFRNAIPPDFFLLVAIGAGLLVGYKRARTHEVFEKDGGIFAQRTMKYLLIWVIAYASTQILGTVARSVFLVSSGLLTGAFTTAMLLVVSLVLLRKRASLVKGESQ